MHSLYPQELGWGVFILANSTPEITSDASADIMSLSAIMSALASEVRISNLAVIVAWCLPGLKQTDTQSN